MLRLESRLREVPPELMLAQPQLMSHACCLQCSALCLECFALSAEALLVRAETLVELRSRHARLFHSCISFSQSCLRRLSKSAAQSAALGGTKCERLL